MSRCTGCLFVHPTVARSCALRAPCVRPIGHPYGYPPTFAGWPSARRAIQSLGAPLSLPTLRHMPGSGLCRVARCSGARQPVQLPCQGVHRDIQIMGTHARGVPIWGSIRRAVRLAKGCTRARQGAPCAARGLLALRQPSDIGWT